MNGKRVFSGLLALVMSLLFLTLPAFAASPLSRKDFDLIDDEDGWKNAVTYWEKTGDEDTCWYFTEDLDWYLTTEENRGLTIACSEYDVIHQYGRGEYLEVEEDALDWIDEDITWLVVPTHARLYCYDNQYYKMFYFDDDNELDAIVWYWER